MGSAERCATCGGAMVNDYCQLEDGEIVPDNYCINCGRRPPITPKCTSPIREEIHKSTYGRRKPRPPMEYRDRRMGCYNCEREEINIYARGLCDFCDKHRDNLAEAKYLVQHGMVGRGQGSYYRMKRKRENQTVTPP